MKETVGRLEGVVVLGTDRSGTSATARMFHLSGFYMGSDADMMAADGANPRGYFENLNVLGANEQVLGELSGHWFDQPVRPDELASGSTQARPLREVLASLQAAAGSAPVALKDPRIGQLIQLWRPLFQGALHPVLVVRHPAEVALSLESRDETAIPVALAMWELRMARILAGLEGLKVTVAPYAQALADPALGCTLVAQVRALLQPQLHSAVDWRRAGGAFEPEIRRSRAETVEGWLTDRQSRIWEMLNSLDAGLTEIDVPTWLKEQADRSRALEIYEAARSRRRFELGARVETAERELAIRDRRMTEQDGQLAALSTRLACTLDTVANLEAELDSSRTATRRRRLTRRLTNVAPFKRPPA